MSTIWEKGGKGWVYVNNVTGKVALELTNAEYKDRLRRIASLEKNTIADNTAEDLKEELQATKESFYNQSSALDPFMNIDINSIVKIGFIALVGKMILNKIL